MCSVPFTLSDQNFVGFSYLVRATCLPIRIGAPHSSCGGGTVVKLG